MLKKSGSYSGLLLDEYKDASLRVGKQTLFLDNVKHVGAVNTSKSKPFAFQVVVLARSPLLFACDNELLRNEWMAVFSRYTEESINSSSDHRKSPEGNLIAFSQVFGHPIPIPSYFKQLYNFHWASIHAQVRNYPLKRSSLISIHIGIFIQVIVRRGLIWENKFYDSRLQNSGQCAHLWSQQPGFETWWWRMLIAVACYGTNQIWYIHAYIHALVGRKETNNYTLISTSLFHDCSLIRR